ncbi:MAG TPA: hypothetical protein VFJ90_07510, partial [Candidatus Didemnitutus sp.]|nr:hypothetical protein [Candidatus Didemnitutus sp.]
AAALEISEDTAKQRLARGGAMLTERMSKLVEETLERSAPTPAFAATVLILLPGSMAPTVVETIGGNPGIASSTLAAAGAAGSVVAKGSVALKVVSLVAFLPALMNGVADFARFRVKHNAVADPTERRRAAWAYLVKHASFGLVILAMFVVPPWIRGHGFSWAYVAVGVALVAGLWAGVVSERRLLRESPDEKPSMFAKLVDQKTSPFEYCTAESLFGLPFMHVRLGGRRAWRNQPAVKAWIAISDGHAYGLVFASGVVAIAPVSLGVVSAGLLGLGALTAGIWAMGCGAVGWVCQAVAAAGWQAKGVFVLAHTFGSGWAGLAEHFNDAAARAFFSESAFGHFSAFVLQGFVLAAWMGWLMPVVLTGWQLWRTRRGAEQR